MKKIYLPPEHFDKVCRVCLSEYTPLISIAEITLTHNLKPNGKVENVPLISIFERFCAVKVEPCDKKPQKVCEFCIDMACKAFNFFQLFIYSDSLLDRKLRKQSLIQSKPNSKENKSRDKSISSQVKAKNTPVIANCSRIYERGTSEIDGCDNTMVQNDTENFECADVFKVGQDIVDLNDAVILDGTVDLDGTVYFEGQETAIKTEIIDDTMIPEDAGVKNEMSTEEISLIPSLKDIKIKIEEDVLVDKNPSKKARKRHRSPIKEIGLQMDSVTKEALRMLTKGKNKRILEESKIKHPQLKSMGKLLSINDIFKCRFCKKTFQGIDKVMTHINEEHESLNKCILCTRKFRNKTRFRYHVASHSLNSLICRPCLLVFETKEELEKHLELFDHTDLTKCTRCQKTFKRRHMLRKHMEAVHLENNKFQCRHCGKLFRYQANVTRHEINSHGSKNYLCQICGKDFSTHYMLKLHMQQVHKIQLGLKKYVFKKKPQNKDKKPNKPKPPQYKCKFCDRDFSKPSLFYQHSEAHPDFKDYKCLLCNKMLKTKKEYDAHYETHKTFKCRDQSCPRMFTTNMRALAHSYSHKKRFKCETCNASFVSQQALRDHMNVHTRERPYICEKCGQGFRQSQHLRVHVTVQHQGNGKPWQCHLCNKAFTFSSMLKIHMRSHTGYKPFPCLYCDKMCRDTVARNKHVKKDHPENMEEFLAYKEEYQEYEKLQIREKSPESE